MKPIEIIRITHPELDEAQLAHVENALNDGMDVSVHTHQGWERATTQTHSGTSLETHRCVKRLEANPAFVSSILYSPDEWD